MPSCRSLLARPSRELDDGRAHHGQLAVLVPGLLLDLGDGAALGEALARHLRVDIEDVALGVVAANLARRASEEAVVAHPVGQMMGQPGAPLRAVVVDPWRAHRGGEVALPVHALRTVGHAEAVVDAETRVSLALPPRELVRPDVEAAPALRVGDESRHRHRALHHGGEPLALDHVLPVARRGAADLLGLVQGVDPLPLLPAVAPGRAVLEARVLSAGLARVVALGAEAPA